MNKMNFWIRHRVLLINILVALAITLFVNFSDLVMFAQGQTRWRPPQHVMCMQMVYFFILSFVAVTLNTGNRPHLILKILYTVAIIAAVYPIMPAFNRDGEMILQWSARIRFGGMPVMKTSFVAITSILYGTIFRLIYQKQNVIIENQLLKNENLQTRYNMLVNQISPHFLFNSLTSLSMLVRSEENDKALHYIDKMSDTFRYMLQSGEKDMTTLERELSFVEAYMYLHTIRYENKLFFDIDADSKYLAWKIPNMSLQPLIENAVKHNAITSSKPLRISFRTIAGGSLVVENPIVPKIASEPGTGIGLGNLSSRYLLLTGKDIKITHSDTTFTVILPLIKP